MKRRKPNLKTIMAKSARWTVGFRTKLPDAASIFCMEGDTDLKNPLSLFFLVYFLFLKQHANIIKKTHYN